MQHSEYDPEVIVRPGMPGLDDWGQECRMQFEDNGNQYELRVWASGVSIREQGRDGLWYPVPENYHHRFEGEIARCKLKLNPSFR